MAKKKKLKRANGTGSIVYLGDRRRKPWAPKVTTGFDTYVTDEGEVKVRQITSYLGYYATELEAELELALYNADPSDPALFNLTFEQAYQCLLKDREHLSEATKSSYRTNFNKFKRLHKDKVRRITTAMLRKEMDKLTTEATQMRAKTFLSVLFGWCVDMRIIKENPAEYLKISVESEKRTATPYTTDEIKTLWEHKDIPACWVSLIQIYTGCRISEVLGIKEEDVHLEDGYLDIHGTKTANAERIVPIRDEIRELFTFESGHLLLTPSGKEYSSGNYTNYHYNPTMERLGMGHHRTHDGRHTFISLADDAGINSTALKFIVGHARSGTTEKVYTHKNLDVLKREIDKIVFM